MKKLKPGLRSAGCRQRSKPAPDEYREAGVPEKLAADIAGLPSFALVPEIMQIAERTGEPLGRAAESYFAVSQTFRVGQAAGGRRPDRHLRSLRKPGACPQHRPDRQRTARYRDLGALRPRQGETAGPGLACGQDRIRINRIAEELSSLSDSGDPNLARITVAAGLLTDLARDRAR